MSIKVPSKALPRVLYAANREAPHRAGWKFCPALGQLCCISQSSSAPPGFARRDPSEWVVYFDVVAVMNLQQLLQAVRNTSSRPEDLQQLLKQLKVSDDSLRSQAQNIIEALTHLEPARNSLGYVYFL